jgi:predicted ester cyclase
MPPTGKELAMTGITILQLADGKIAEVWTEADGLGVIEQLGVIPERVNA